MIYLLVQIFYVICAGFNFVATLFLFLIETIGVIILYILFLPVDGFLTVIEIFFEMLDITSYIPNIESAYGNLPNMLLYFLSAIGIPQGLTILALAYALRLLLNLIPGMFTRV